MKSEQLVIAVKAEHRSFELGWTLEQRNFDTDQTSKLAVKRPSYFEEEIQKLAWFIWWLKVFSVV